jgi:hypothetical protein
MLFKDLEETKSFLEFWNKASLSDAKKNQISLMVEAQGFLFFFTYHDEVFGATEDARVTFARMKEPDPGEESKGWLSEANFTAMNLTKALFGQPAQQIFKHKDLPEIKVIKDKEKVYDMLVKQAEDIPHQNLAAGLKMVIKRVNSQPQ